MMQYIRERATSKFAKFLFLGIIISFFGFGGSGFFENAGNSTVAKVNGEKISVDALSNAYTTYLQNNGGVLPEGTDAKTVKAQVLNSLIQEVVIAQATNKMGVIASDDEMRSAIKSLTFLHNADGEFDSNLYQYYLQQQGLTAAQWEANLRQQLTLQLLVSAIGNSAIITEASLEDFAKLDREKRNLSIITLPLDQFTKDVVVTDDMVSGYFAQNKASFMAEPRIKIAYVTLPMIDDSTVTVSDDEIAQRVEILKAQQANNETRSSDQLIIQFNTDAEKETALATLNALYEDLLVGKVSFDEAKAQVTALPDGLFYETGVVKRSENMDSVSTALFSVAKDAKYAQPVSSENAVHLIHVLAINDGSNISDDALLAQAKTALLKEKKEQVNAENVQNFQEVAERNADSLELLAQEFNIEPVVTDWLNVTTKEGELSDSNTLQVVMQEMVLSGGKNSEAYHTDNQDIRIVRVEAYEPARPLTMKEANKEITELLVTLEAQKKADAIITEMNEKLKSADKTIDQIASDYSITVGHYNNVEIRNIMELVQNNPEIIEPIIKGFEVQKSEPLVLHSFPTGNAVAAVLVNDVIAGDISEYNDDEKAQLKERLKTEIAQGEAMMFIQGLYEESKIETYQVPFLME